MREYQIAQRRHTRISLTRFLNRQFPRVGPGMVGVRNGTSFVKVVSGTYPTL
jgi:hypothetical protein